VTGIGTGESETEIRSTKKSRYLYLETRWSIPKGTLFVRGWSRWTSKSDEM